MKKWLPILLATTCLVTASGMGAFANPLDGTVVAGDAKIAGEGTAQVTVNQSSNKAIIDWRSFNIAPNETTQFNQPSASSVVLNRVTGGEGMSTIAGSLKANGNVFLINPDGILFGKDSIVDVGGLVASTHDITNSDFMAGRYNFNQSGNSSASIVNLGTINVEDNGFAALVAPGVRNAGVIRARLGTVALGSANGFSLDFYGDDLLTLAVDSETAGTIIDVATGEPITALVDNNGLISADGGTIQLTATAARAVVDAVVNTSGTLEANSVGMRNGKIVLGASTAPSSNARPQKLKVSGKVSTAGTQIGETGGHIELTAEIIELTVATIDAFGYNGGGTVLIGGDYMGGNPDAATVAEYEIPLEDHDIATATVVMLDENTTVSADAIEEGDGGKIIVWSDHATVTSADLSARGGAVSGDGGFIETSGKYLDVNKAADASAPNGEAGTWLLDPLDIHIKNAASTFGNFTIEEFYPGVIGPSQFPTGTPSVLSTADAEAALNAGTNIRVTTRGTVGGEPGDIYVDDDITKSAGGDVFLNLNAANDIIFASGVDLVSTSGEVTFHVYATDGEIRGNNVGTIDLNGGQLMFAARDGVDFNSLGDMPDLLTLDVSPTGQSPDPLVTYDVSFDLDRTLFTHDNTTATFLSGGTALVDPTATGTAQIILNGLNVGLQDQAVVIQNNRSFQVSVDSNKAIGSLQPLNSLPEITSDGSFVPDFRNAIATGIVPVLQVQSTDAANCKTLTCFVTGPGGQDVLDEFLNPILGIPANSFDPITNDQPLGSPFSAPPVGEGSASDVIFGLNLKPASEIFGINPITISPTDRLVHEIAQSYGYDRKAINLVAENADYAVLAALVYGDEGDIESILPSGWSAISDNENISLSVLGIDQLAGDLQYQLFRDQNGKVVLAFSGTNELYDHLDNFVGQLLPSPMVVTVQEIARSFAEIYPDITFVGHSLGGRLANIARLETGKKAVVFDASITSAPEHLAYIASVGRENLQSFRGPNDPLSALAPLRGDTVVANMAKVDADALLDNQWLVDLAAAFDSIVPGGYSHNMGELAKSMQVIKSYIDKINNIL